MADEQLLLYLRQVKAAGKPDEDIYKELLAAGHTVPAIQDALAELASAGNAAESRGRVTRILLLIGAVLVGAGVFSFIAANWDGMDDFAKVVIILLGVVVFSGSGWYLRVATEYEKTGNALLLIGSLIYGGGIFLVAQIFNIQADWADGFVLWMLGTLAMAWATNIPALFGLSLTTGIIAVIGYPFGIFGDGLSGIRGARGILGASFTLLLIACIAAFVSGHVMRKKVLVKPPA